MSIIPANTDYTAKDYDSFVARAFNLIRSVFPDWTETKVANFGNILLGLEAFGFDIISKYQDNQAAESRLSTAKLRKNIIAAAKFYGYTPRGASPATAVLRLTLSSAATATIPFQKGDKFSTPEVTSPVKFQLLQNFSFAIGDLEREVVVEHSEFAEDVFTSSGLPNQAFVLKSLPFIDGSLSVSAADGSYSEKPNLLDSVSTDRHFTVSVDQNDRATVRFGNGVNGAIPSGTVTLQYKIGGGAVGNVEPNTIKRAEFTIRDVNGQSVRMTITNPGKATGGRDRESNNLIKTNAPLSLRVQGRAVAREDYEIAALQIPGVARALHLTNNEKFSVGENEGLLFIVPAGGGTPTSTLLSQVAAQFAEGGPYPSTVTYRLSVQQPIYKVIDVSSVVYLQPGVAAATVKAAIVSALKELFSLTNSDGTPNRRIDFGYYIKDANGNPANEIAWSEIFNVVRDTTGVRKVDPGASGLLLNGERDDVALGAFEFPTLGTITLTNGDTGVVL